MRGMRSNELAVACGAALLFLTGCSTTGTPGIKIQTQEVDVVQYQHCVDKKDIPSKPAPLSSQKRPTLLEDQLRVTLAKIGEWVKYGNVSDPLLQACATSVLPAKTTTTK